MSSLKSTYTLTVQNAIMLIKKKDIKVLNYFYKSKPIIAVLQLFTKRKILLKNTILLITLSLFFTGCSTLNKTKVILPPSWIGMQEIAPDVYVDKDMNQTEQQRLMKIIPEAKKYTTDIWGELQSQPAIYACSTKKCSKALGIGARAHQILNHLVLSPKGITKELIAHEWSHAELYKRVGGFLNWRKIPSWFDEGVAVLVSHEPRHDERAWKKIQDENLSYPPLNALTTSKQWNQATKKYNENIDKNDIVITYAVAGHEVSLWYKKVGTKGLNALIQKVKNASAFEDVYNKGNK